MRILIALSHPAHYHLFKNLATELKTNGKSVIFVAKEKDILIDLLEHENVEFYKICPELNRGRSALRIIGVANVEMMIEDFNLFRFVKKWKPTIMIGTDISITHVGKLLKIPSLVFNEDDYEINKLFCLAAYPFATNIISPLNCSVGSFVNKKIAYDGYQKLAYTHPKYFKPDLSLLKKLQCEYHNYFLIRLVNLTAVHDIEGKHTGLTETIIDMIIERLSPHGKVFVNVEGNSDEKYSAYRIPISSNQIHTFLAGADLFIGDSQTMAAEAGLLGTPFIRFNDFVGKINYLKDIENKYSLGVGIESNNVSGLFLAIDNIMNQENIKIEWQKRRMKLFEEKINVTEFWLWLIEEYPKSTALLRSNKAIQDKFK